MYFAMREHNDATSPRQVEVREQLSPASPNLSVGLALDRAGRAVTTVAARR
jgi:hypothetical protein